ncbi:bifunctional diguanylate cyclase/phosphodiesterase [Paracraurococcus lichenis]|uniref:EAL domain-containing protein n=1 Tax=Paracraurococcus lichenis TaxID=3064888 RepID=A0ABT9EBW7_9PROT|nr:EAL domain-containing protein [Paracraurococcus sp. LOR1-02]MDO9713701.1 EAL domain-containing protein [Paracraurococcus sp. LOR1-02]
MPSFAALVLQSASRIRPSVWRGFVGAALGLVLAVSAGVYLLQEREAALRDAEREARNLSLILANWVEAGFRSVEQLEAGVLDWIRAEGIGTPEAFAERMAARETHDTLRARIASLPRVRRLLITDATGRTAATSLRWPAPDLNSSGRDFFDALRDDPRRESMLSVPWRAQVDGQWNIYLSHRINAPDGRFLGVVAAAIDLDYFERIFASLALGPDSAVSLIRRDGIRLARYPRAGKEASTSAAAGAIFQRVLPSAQDGAIIEPSFVDGRMRLKVVRALQDYPLAILTTRGVDEILVPWRREARRLGSAVLLLEMLILGTVLLLQRHDRQRRAVRRLLASQAESEARLAVAAEREKAAEALAESEARLRASEAMLRMSLEAGDVGIYTRDLMADGVIQCGPETRALHGLPQGDAPIPIEVLVGLMLPEDRERISGEIADALARREPELCFQYRFRHPADGKVRHIEARTRYEYDAAGRPLSSIGVVIDVTASREAEALTRLSLEIGRIGNFRHDLTARLVYASPEARALYGLPAGPNPMPDEAWFAAVVPEDQARLRARIEQSVADRAAEADFEYRVQPSAEGVLRHFEARARFDYDADGVPVSVVGVVIDVTERREAEARIAHIAHHDALTGLPNRTLFRERLEEALARARRGTGCALLCLDLDHFKEVNDTLGHPVGDALLKAVTARLLDSVRETDTVARLGGDEFAIVQTDSEQPTAATTLAKRLVEALSAPFELDGQQIVVGTSIGIAMVPGDGEDADTLLKNADMALYRAKAEGRGRWRFFEPEMDARMQLRRALETDLRRALAAGEFELFYQPIVAVASRQVSGLEALIRWRHPERGLVPPDAFIPLAEEIGLIVPIGEWVLAQACREAVSWTGTPKVAVNLSPVQFASRGLVDAVAAALELSGLDPARLELEITETVMLQDTQATLATLHRLKGLGVRIAMDDFGTGYSSLSYLQRFPFDKVKIDRSFTRELGQSRQSGAIVGAVTDLCLGLDMTTTAEGVESEAQFAALLHKGCQEAQGYLFSRPCPGHEVPGLLDRLEQDARVKPEAA